MGAMASQIAGLKIVYSNVRSGANQTKHQNFASLAFMRGIHWWPVNSPHKRPVTRKMFPFKGDIMQAQTLNQVYSAEAMWLKYIISVVSH